LTQTLTFCVSALVNQCPSNVTDFHNHQSIFTYS